MSAVVKTSLYAPSQAFLPPWGQGNGAEQREEGSLIANAEDGRHAVGLCRIRGGLITAMQALQYKAGFWLLGFGLRGLPLRQVFGGSLQCRLPAEPYIMGN